MKTGVLLINLGTPDGTSVKEVRAYLREFFSDPFVFDINPVGRWLLRNLIILPFRSPRSAGLYQSIWGKNGSPLLQHTMALRDRISIELGKAFTTETAMNYGNPSIQSAVEKLKDANIDQVIILPLFPQSSQSTTLSAISHAEKVLRKTLGDIPRFTISGFFDHPLFTAAWVDRIKPFLSNDIDALVMSYHGIPERHIKNTDAHGYCLKEGCCDGMTAENANCYRAQCLATSRHIASALYLEKDRCFTAFQSRFGKAKWIRPYMSDLLPELAAAGKKRILVACPSFVCDCLETLHEVAVEYRQNFLDSGGVQLTFIPCPNESEKMAQSLADIIREKSRN